MASKAPRDWFDMSSELSSLSGTSGSRLHPLRTEPGPEIADNFHQPMAELSIDDQSRSSPPLSASPRHGIRAFTAASDAGESDAANAVFYQSSALVSKASAPYSNPATSRKRRRHEGPIDQSGSTYPSGLADIQVPPPWWRGREPLGTRIPSQLVKFGKYNMRYEAGRDLPPDEAFDRWLPDSQQSFHTNHYAGQDPNDFPNRPPSPPLPGSVMENLQLRTQTMVDAYTAAKEEHAELSRRESTLDAKVQSLQEQLAYLDRQLATASQTHGALKKAFLDRGIDLGEETAGGLSDSTVPPGPTSDGARPAVEPIPHADLPVIQRGNHEENMSSLPSNMSGVMYGPAHSVEPA